MARALTTEELKTLRQPHEAVLISCDEAIPHFSKAALEFSAEQLNRFFEGRVFYCNEKTGSLCFRNPVGISIFSMLWNAHRFCEEFVGEANPFIFRVLPTMPPSMSVGITNTGFETIDLSGMQPESGYRWVLIAIDDEGPYMVEGKPFDIVPFINVQPRDPEDKKLAAVLLRAGATVISDGPYISDITDLRMMNNMNWSNKEARHLTDEDFQAARRLLGLEQANE